jgi:hypothetical protein
LGVGGRGTLGSHITPGNIPRRVPGSTTFYLLHDRYTP